MHYDTRTRSGDGSDLDAIRERKREQLLGDGGDTDGDASERDPAVAYREIEGETHFSELADSHRLVPVDFYADWCGPCEAMESTIEATAAETEAVVAKVDIDAHRGPAASANVRGVPTLVLHVDGEPVERRVGLQDETRSRSLIGEH